MAEEDNQLRLVLIAGATSALGHLQKNKKATHDDALKHVINHADEIIDKIDLSD